jgi:CRP/FNR family transcriptional regulator, cyclic AMP receptor protein
MERTAEVEAPQLDFRAVARGLGTTQRYAPGDVVFREGDHACFMYVVLTGEVEILSRGRAIERVGEGQALGVVSLIDALPRTATARAAVDSELAQIDARRFRIMVEETPNFVWFVMRELVDRLRATNAAL